MPRLAPARRLPQPPMQREQQRQVLRLCSPPVGLHPTSRMGRFSQPSLLMNEGTPVASHNISATPSALSYFRRASCRDAHGVQRRLDMDADLARRHMAASSPHPAADRRDVALREVASEGAHDSMPRGMPAVRSALHSCLAKCCC
jgi:hypothetical protein